MSETSAFIFKVSLTKTCLSYDWPTSRSHMKGSTQCFWAVLSVYCVLTADNHIKKFVSSECFRQSKIREAWCSTEYELWVKRDYFYILANILYIYTNQLYTLQMRSGMSCNNVCFLNFKLYVFLVPISWIFNVIECRMSTCFWDQNEWKSIVIHLLMTGQIVTL